MRLFFLVMLTLGLGNCFRNLHSFRSCLSHIRRSYKATVNHISDSVIQNPDAYKCLSFFKFVEISDPNAVAQNVRDVLNSISSVKGTLLISNEGVNGQFAVPSSSVKEFSEKLSAADNVLSGISLNLGRTIDYGDNDARFPFRKLSIKVKKRLLTDGLPDDALDWTDNGPEISPDQWHKAVSSIGSTGSDALLLDCRNDYESDMGTFQNAKPLGTTIFSESWKALDEILADVPKDTRILTFCTGGVRCVKTNAYLKQKLGFENIGRLQDGIIGYERWLASEAEKRSQTGKNERESGNDDSEVESVFIGENFLFDRRRLGNSPTNNLE